MAKIGRNVPCPCGSGRKFKRCCGDPLQTQPGSCISADATPRTRPDLLLRRREADELIRTQQQGFGRPMVSAKIGDHQIVAVGNSVYYSKVWRFPADLLSDYIRDVLGSDWGNEELAKSLELRHPIMQWYDSYCKFQSKNKKRPDGSYVAVPTGAVYCYIGLAYNLYLLKHNVELQERMVRRLRNAEQFQGAYYEMIVANVLIRAGFELQLEDETDESSKHCEFAAISKRTSKKYWVEAKMRSEAGILGKTNKDGSRPSSKPTAKLSAHLRSALGKPAKDERLIFIDVNASYSDSRVDEQASSVHPAWVEAAGRQLDAREKDLDPDQRAYVFVTSMPFHRILNEEVQGHGVLAYGLGMPDFAKSGYIRLKDLWKQKQKHVDAHDIIESIKSYPKLPSTFDGRLPLNSADDANRIEIGRQYWFEDGRLGTVTSATMVEAQKKLWVAVAMDDGSNQIFTSDVSDDEFRAYKEHPDAYFGVVQTPGRKTSDLYEIFEWLLGAYRRTPRERLLELAAGCEDYDDLANLNHEELLLELCERWAIAMVMSSKKEEDMPSSNSLEAENVASAKDAESTSATPV